MRPCVAHLPAVRALQFTLAPRCWRVLLLQGHHGYESVFLMVFFHHFHALSQERVSELRGVYLGMTIVNLQDHIDELIQAPHFLIQRNSILLLQYRLSKVLHGLAGPQDLIAAHFLTSVSGRALASNHSHQHAAK